MRLVSESTRHALFSIAAGALAGFVLLCIGTLCCVLVLMALNQTEL